MLITAGKCLNQLGPDWMALLVTRALAGLTQRQRATESQSLAMADAKPLPYGRARLAWMWGAGPVVILVHGWGGSAAQMAPLARHLGALGFSAVALEVTGHGRAPKHHTSWSYFLDDLAELVQAITAPIFACVGHSAGALTMMAARELKSIRARRYVCVAAPSYPFPPINVIKKKLNPRQTVLEDYQRYIAEQFGTTWETLQTGRCYAAAGADTLLVYDETDRFVRHSEGDRLKALCPGATLLKTQRYSHQQILEAPEVLAAIGNFLASTLREEPKWP
jgi:pimeloyl-ACP methyl ester carboxylesterase